MFLSSRYVCCLVLILSTISNAQELPQTITPPPGFQLVQAVGDPTGGTLDGKPLLGFTETYMADSGDVFMRNAFGISNSFTTTVLQKKTKEGAIVNMHAPLQDFVPCDPPVPNNPTCRMSTVYTPWISQSGQIVYYSVIRSQRFTLTINRIINGSELSSVLLDLMGSEYSPSVGVKVNNLGVAALYLTRTNGTKELATIDSLGLKTTIDANIPTLSGAMSFTINDKGTVFVQLAAGANGMFDIYAYPQGLPPKKVGSTYVSGLDNRENFIAPEISNAQYPEGVVYYLRSGHEIARSGDETIVDAFNKGLTINNFSINNEGTIAWTARVDGVANQSVLYKGNRIPEDQVIGPGYFGETVSIILSPRLNNLGELLFSAIHQNGNWGLYQSVKEEKLCDVKDKGRNVVFWSQADPRWNTQTPIKYYANIGPRVIKNEPIPGQLMRKWGCGTTSLAMIFDSYGIKKLHTDRDLDPGSLNESMYLLSQNEDDPTGYGYNENGAILWAEAAQVARVGYAYQCFKDPLNPQPLDICHEESRSRVSYKNSESYVQGRNGPVEFFETKDAYEARLSIVSQSLFETVEKEICEGNPVLIQVHVPGSSSRMHFMVATGVTRDAQKNKTLIVNNPGAPDARRGQEIRLSDLKDKYPYLTGYRRFVPARDPAMIFGYGSNNIHFIITDPMGRRFGYDPINKIGYSEIPEGNYYLESYNTPNEPDVPFETLTVQNVFEQTVNVVDGNYRVQIFGVEAGSYNFKMTSHDVAGDKNNETDFSGVISVGEVKTFNYKHSSAVLPTLNAKMNISQVLYSDISFLNIQPMVLITGQMNLAKNEELSLGSAVQISIGSPTDFSRTIDALKFKIKRVGKNKDFYIDLSRDEKILIKSDGKFLIQIRGREILDLSDEKKQNIFIKIGSKSAFKKVELKCGRNICIKK